MVEETAAEDSKPQKSKRKWWRLHRSTLVFVFLFSIPWALIAIPGAHYDCPYKNPKVEFFVHGWPAIHATQVRDAKQYSDDEFEEIVDFRHHMMYRGFKAGELQWANDNYWYYDDSFFGDVGTKRFWSEPRNWNYFSLDSRWSWSFGALLINLGLLTGYLLLLTLVVEWLRRRKRSWYQLTVLEILLIVGPVSVVAAWLTNSIQRCRSDVEKYRQLREHATILSMGVESSTPVWLDRLFDGAFDRKCRKQWCYQHFGRDHANLNTLETDGNRLPLFSQLNVSAVSAKDGEKTARILNDLNSESIVVRMPKGDTDESVKLLNSLDADMVDSLLLMDNNAFVSGEPSKKASPFSRELQHAARFTKIDYLVLESFEIPLLERWPETRYLRLEPDCTDPNQNLKKWLSQSKRLRDLEGSAVVVESIDSLPKALESLTLEIPHTSGEITESSLLTLGSLPKSLKSLKLKIPNHHPSESQKVSLSKLKGLDQLNDLELELSPYFAPLKEVDFTYPVFPNLKYITLESVKLDQRTIDWLGALPELKVLWLRDYSISDEELEELRRQLSNIQIQKR